MNPDNPLLRLKCASFFVNRNQSDQLRRNTQSLMAASYFKTRKDELEDLTQYEVEKKSSNIDGIKYFDAYQEVLATDELMEYKGVHFKFAMNASRFTNLYGRIKVKNTNNLEKALYQADLGGEHHYRSKSSQAFCK